MTLTPAPHGHDRRVDLSSFSDADILFLARFIRVDVTEHWSPPQGGAEVIIAKFTGSCALDPDQVPSPEGR